MKVAISLMVIKVIPHTRHSWCNIPHLLYAAMGVTSCAVFVTYQNHMNSVMLQGRMQSLPKSVSLPDAESSTSSSDTLTCHSLITITAASHTPRLISPPFRLPNTTDLRQALLQLAPRLDDFEKPPMSVADVIQKIVNGRDSMAGASTSDYQILAKFLPKLLFSGNISQIEEKLTRKVTQKDEKRVVKIKLTPPFLIGKSRIEATGGKLPYVPCLVAPYSDPSAFSTCAKRRLQNRSRLWLYFMGDSKIRDVFDELLTRTDAACKYDIHYWKLNQTWQVVKKSMNVLRWSDMEATTSAAPHLKITYAFRRFNSMTPSKLNKTKEILKLDSWASRRESPPDLLVIGYSTWMMLWRKNSKTDTLDFLDGLQQMHMAVMPLLRKISQWTRVLVLCQSRFRPYSEASLNHQTALAAANLDWNEAGALLLLRPRVEASSSTTTHHTQALNDPLHPASSPSGPWWWDSGLPLNLAGHRECEELYRLGLTDHPAYRGALLACHDPHHAGTVTNTDMVTMLLNLLCNSVLQLDQHYCCS